MLLGRVRELASVATLLARRAPVVLVGHAGVGKTTLARTALDEHGPWRETGALATLRWTPMLVFRRLLGDGMVDDPDRVAARVLRSDPGSLLLDDLQWADELTMHVIGRLAERLPMVATVRRGDPDAERIVDELAAAGLTPIDIGPLPPAASRRVLQVLRPELSRVSQAQILDRAAGNPLLLTELGHETASPTLVRAMHDRLTEAPAPVRTAMERLSLLGRPACPRDLGPGSSELVRSGLAVERDGSIEVSHALLAEIVVAGLGARRARRCRELAATVPADEGAFLLAGAGELELARASAIEAVAAASKGVAAELLVLIVRCAPAGDLDVDHRVRAMRALTAGGRPLEALALSRAAGVEDLDPVSRGTIRGAAAEAAWHAHDRDRFIALIGAALDDLGGSGTEAEVEVLAGSTIADTRVRLDGRPAVSRATRAVELADELGMKRGFARARLGSVLLTSGQEGWLDAFRTGSALALEEGDFASWLVAQESLMLGRWITGAVHEAAASAEALFLAGPPIGHEVAWRAQAAYGALIAVQAALDRRTVIERWEAFVLEEPGFRNRPYVQAAVALARADLGDHDAARAVLVEPADWQRGEPQSASVIGWARAETALLGGRLGEAMATADLVAGLGIDGFPPAVAARLVAGHARRDLGLPVSGDAPAAHVSGWSGASPEWGGLVASSDGDHSQAVVRFDEATRAWEGNDHRSATRAAWAAADAARLAGHPDAIERLRAVEALSTERQLANALARTRRSLRAMGIRSAGTRSTAGGPIGPSGLTERQSQVLGRVGAGLTSREIADELHISRSTVDSLVRSAVRRLGTSNRHAAAAALLGRTSGEDQPSGRSKMAHIGDDPDPSDP